MYSSFEKILIILRNCHWDIILLLNFCVNIACTSFLWDTYPEPFSEPTQTYEIYIFGKIVIGWKYEIPLRYLNFDLTWILISYTWYIWYVTTGMCIYVFFPVFFCFSYFFIHLFLPVYNLLFVRMVTCLRTRLPFEGYPWNALIYVIIFYT